MKSEVLIFQSIKKGLQYIDCVLMDFSILVMSPMNFHIQNTVFKSTQANLDIHILVSMINIKDHNL